MSDIKAEPKRAPYFGARSLIWIPRYKYQYLEYFREYGITNLSRLTLKQLQGKYFEMRKKELNEEGKSNTRCYRCG